MFDFLSRFLSREQRQLTRMRAKRLLVDWHAPTPKPPTDEEVANSIRDVPTHYADGIYYVDRRLPFGVADYGGITLTTAQKCLWAPGATNPCILPANYWTIGKTLRLTANLKWTAVANTNTITAGMQYGAADAAAANVITQAGTGVSSTTVFNVLAQGYATCRTIGTGGTLSMFGGFLFPSGLIVAGILNFPVAGVTVVSTIDTTVGTNGLSFQALRGTAAGDTVAATDILLEAMN